VTSPMCLEIMTTVNHSVYLIKRITDSHINHKFPPPSTTIMFSSQQAASPTTSATSAVKTGFHNSEGAKKGASGPIQADTDHSADTYDGLTSSGKVCSETTRARSAVL